MAQSFYDVGFVITTQFLPKQSADRRISDGFVSRNTGILAMKEPAPYPTSVRSLPYCPLIVHYLST